MMVSRLMALRAMIMTILKFRALYRKGQVMMMMD